MSVEIVGLVTIIIAGIASFVTIKVKQSTEIERLNSLEAKHDADHIKLVKLQADKDKELWIEIRAFQKNFVTIGQSLGRVEGKLDFLSHGNIHGS